MSVRGTRAAHRGLLAELDLALELCADGNACERREPEVSGWAVKEHLEHCLLADEGLIGWIAATGRGEADTDGPGRPTLPGRLVLWLGWIPRGRGRSPESVLPEGDALVRIRERYGSLRGRVAQLRDVLPVLARAAATRRHPALGCLTPAEWLRFLQVHHAHHRGIVEDILSQG